MFWDTWCIHGDCQESTNWVLSFILYRNCIRKPDNFWATWTAEANYTSQTSQNHPLWATSPCACKFLFDLALSLASGIRLVFQASVFSIELFTLWEPIPVRHECPENPLVFRGLLKVNLNLLWGIEGFESNKIGNCCTFTSPRSFVNLKHISKKFPNGVNNLILFKQESQRY